MIWFIVSSSVGVLVPSPTVNFQFIGSVYHVKIK